MDCDPDLGKEELEVARRQVLALAVDHPRGPWEVEPDDFDRARNLGLLAVDGLMSREVTVAEYTCAEMIGPGDVLQPWLRIGPDQSVATEVD